MICASPVRASTVINGGSGSIDAHTGIGNPETQCVCTTQKSIELPPDPPTMSSDTADCSSCSANGVTVGTAHVDAGFSGNSQFLSYTAHGHGDPSSDHAVLLIDSFSASSITFTISGQAEVVQIAASLTIQRAVVPKGRPVAMVKFN